MTDAVPADLTAALDALARTAAGGSPVLVALDFDGALAPLQDDPEDSRALPAAVEAMAVIAGSPAVHLALVSGRALTDLFDKAEVPDGTLLVGSHGAERGRVADGALERLELELPEDAAARRAEVAETLEAAVAGTTARLEHKPAAVVLHTRTADRPDAERLTEFGLRLGERQGVDAMRGKEVVELSVLHVTKGDALATLREETGAAALLYAGDDITDERAFATLRPDDVTVRVGDGATAARFRVAGPDALSSALAHLAEAVGRA